MQVAGVICEYNPFHLGHGAMLQELRRQGMDAIVCCMSGNFVQRGEWAIARKFARAEMALRCGADLVLELPTPWSAATAEVFARGGAGALHQTGVVTHLAFGSECGDAGKIRRTARALDTPEYETALRRLLAGGATFAACRQQAAEELVGADAEVLSRPNDNLAVEYCRALDWLGSGMEPLAVRRVGAGHDAGVESGIASASHIRRLLYEGSWEEALGLMPPEAAAVLRRELDCGAAPVSPEHCSRGVLDRLQRLTEEDLAAYDGGGEGLYHRFYRAVRSSCDLEELLQKAKTKRYTLARLRRLLLAAYLDLPSAPLPRSLPYLRLLGANDRGRQLLRQMEGVPVLTKAADVSRLGPAAEELLKAEARRTDLYRLAFPKLSCDCWDAEWRDSPVLL